MSKQQITDKLIKYYTDNIIPKVSEGIELSALDNTIVRFVKSGDFKFAAALTK